MKAFGSINGGVLTPVNQIGGNNGNSRLQRADGLVASCQPDGTIEWRPATDNGPYEWCKPSGAVVTFQPVADKAYVFTLTDGPTL